MDLTLRGAEGELRVRLCESIADEACPVTCEAMGEGEIPHAPAGARVQADRPELVCVQAPCGHRFDAAAFLVHCLRNGMRCPMCRAGATPRLLLSASPPLAAVRWLAEAERAVASAVATEAAEEAGVDPDGATTSLILMQDLQVSLAMEALSHVPVNASVFLFDAEGNRPRQGLVMRMRLLTGRAGLGYGLGSDDLRSVSQAIRGVAADTISVDLYAIAPVSGALVPLMAVQRHAVRPVTSAYVTPMGPMGSGLEIEFDNDLRLVRLAFMPGQIIIYSMFNEVLDAPTLSGITGQR